MPEGTGRRRFLETIIKGSLLIISALTIIPGVGMLLAPVLSRGARKLAKVVFANPQDAQSTTFVLARLEGSDETAPGVFAKRGPDGKPVVLSSMCTHAGCPVEWHGNENRFFCPCHRGIFDADGKNVGGPPPKPLARLAATVRDGDIYVEASEA